MNLPWSMWRLDHTVYVKGQNLSLTLASLPLSYFFVQVLALFKVDLFAFPDKARPWTQTSHLMITSLTVQQPRTLPRPLDSDRVPPILYIRLQYKHRGKKVILQNCAPKRNFFFPKPCNKTRSRIFSTVCGELEGLVTLNNCPLVCWSFFSFNIFLGGVLGLCWLCKLFLATTYSFLNRKRNGAIPPSELQLSWKDSCTR